MANNQAKQLTTDQYYKLVMFVQEGMHFKKAVLSMPGH